MHALSDFVLSLTASSLSDYCRSRNFDDMQHIAPYIYFFKCDSF